MCLSIAIARPNDVLAKGVHLGFEWVVTKNGAGFRCGYVKVEKNHPWFGKYDGLDINIHGGVTFAEPDVPCDKGGADDGYWIGFDCAHSGDAQDPSLSPSFTMPMWGGIVRTQEYAESECKSLCEQAKAAFESVPPIIND